VEYLNSKQNGEKVSLEDHVEEIVNTIQPIGKKQFLDLHLPSRTIIDKDALNKHDSIVIVGGYTILTLAKFGKEIEQYWFGPCIITNNEKFTKRLAKRYIKGLKNDNGCYVVWS
jgi:hypothetical protein